jgi:hypothetical protein
VLNVPSDGERETTAATSPSPSAKKRKQRHRTTKSRLDFILMKICRYMREDGVHTIYNQVGKVGQNLAQDPAGITSLASLSSDSELPAGDSCASPLSSSLKLSGFFCNKMSEPIALLPCECPLPISAVNDYLVSRGRFQTIGIQSTHYVM